MTYGTDERSARRTTDDAFRAVFAEHHTRLFRLACLLTGDTALADEVTAEVFARVLPKWRAGAVDEPLAYLRRSVVNEVRSRHRRRAHEVSAATRWRARSTELVLDEHRVLDAPVIEALRNLPPRQRAVVVLRFHDDLSELEVARILGMAPGSVKSHASRGLARLRIALEHSLTEEDR